jgi:hypothetical protein
MMWLLASPHFVPTGCVVAVMGCEIVTQLLSRTHAATAAKALTVNFIVLIGLS